MEMQETEKEIRKAIDMRQNSSASFSSRSLPPSNEAGTSTQSEPPAVDSFPEPDQHD